MRLQMFVREKGLDSTVIVMAINTGTRGSRKVVPILGEIPVQVSVVVPISRTGPFSWTVLVK